MTLIETLAALAILSLVTAGGGAWVVITSRAAQSSTTASRESMILTRTINAIRADLIEAASETIEMDPERNEIRVITARAAPGADPGWRRATWRSSDGELIRVEKLILPNDDSGESQGIILRDVESFIITRDEPAEDGPGFEVFTIILRLRSGAEVECVWSVER